MNFFELCEKLQLSPSTLMTNFRRTQKNLEKKGILLVKEGEGKKAQYFILDKENKNG